MTTPDLKIELIDIAKLTPDPANARKHDERNLSAIAASLEKFGQRRPIVVTADGVVLAGNGTLEAAKGLGWTKIAIARTPKDWDHDRARAYALADNRTAELAAWDEKLLADQLYELDAAGWEIADLGFDQLQAPGMPPEEEVIPEVPAEPTARLGDLWVVGEHRILCGDSSDKATLDRVFGDVTVGCVLTDPPYGMNLDTQYSGMHKANGFGKGGNDYRPVIGDDRPYDAEPLIDYFGLVKEQFWWGADYYRTTIPSGGSWLVWDKRHNDSGMQLDKLLGAAFELCWSKQAHKREILRHLWSGHHGMQGEDTRSRVHLTQKPVSLLVDILERWAPVGCIVADPYGGSGATLVAAAKSGRTGIGIELDPGYVDVIVQRLEQATGQKATRA